MAIRINYTSTVRRARQIVDLSDDVERLGKDLLASIQAAKEHWRGEASDAYFAQCTDLQNKIMQTSKDMAKVGGTIKTVADIIKQADDELAAKRFDY